MSIQYDSDERLATSRDYSDHHASRPGNQGSSWFRTWAIGIGTIIAAALVALVAASLINHVHTAAPGTSASAPVSTSASTAPTSGSTSAAVTSPVSVKKLQQELGQLNYYQGADDGLMGPQTIAAIKDLQRQAGLPQTGTMNAATQKALDTYLVHGNSRA
jgi:putative peptidoglycan binding protein